MLIRNRVTTLERISVGDWGREPNLGEATESVPVTAHLSDGRTVERTAVMRYASGEREKILENVARGEGTEADVKSMQSILFRRSLAIQKARGELEREFGRGVVEPIV